MPTLVPYELKCERRDGYLYACIVGEKMTETTSEQYLKEIRTECDRGRYRLLMIERRVRHVPDTISKYNIAQRSVEILAGIKTAWLNPYPENQEMLEFATLVANNRGATYCLFTDEREAEQWLLRSADPSSPATPRDTDAHNWLGD